MWMTYRKLWELFDRKGRLSVLGLFVLMLVGAMIEAFAVAAVVPLVAGITGGEVEATWLDRFGTGDSAINQYFGRADLLQYQATTSGKPALAECIASDFYAQFTFEEIASELASAELEAAFVSIEDDCLNSV